MSNSKPVCYKIIMDFIGPIKVNLEFNFSFSGFSFSGLNSNFSGFKPEIYFIFQFQFHFFSYLSAISDCQSWVFFKSLVKPSVLIFFQLIIALWISNLELGSFFLGFKTQVFHIQFLTQTDIPFSRFPNFRPEKGQLLVYFYRPNVESIGFIQKLQRSPNSQTNNFERTVFFSTV